MLTHLQLRDFVLVDQAELELKPGLTALTGETGAGKSIVVDALLLLAGGRAGGDVVRQGAERAEVAASFDALPAGGASLARSAGDRARRRARGAPGDRRGRPLARLCERSTGAHPGIARAGGVPHRNPWPTRIPAPGESRHPARHAGRAPGRLGLGGRRGRTLRALPNLPPRLRVAQIGRREPRRAPRSAALPTRRAQGRGHHRGRHRRALRRPETRRRPRPLGGGGPRRADRRL